MKTLNTYLTVFALAFFCFILSGPAALASNIVIDDDAQPAVSGLYLTSDYTDDAACIQAALDNSKSGDSITIREGDYYIAKQISQQDKSLNIVGEGKVTLHLQTAAGNGNGLYFSGSKITTQSLSANAQKGSSQVILSDASQVRQNDLIKIWKNVKWCPLDYPDQMTGEMYAVQSVNGNVVTLNQPLLREYKLSETVQAEIYRPIEMHIKNIRVQDSGATTHHEGLALKFCKDSSVTDSWFKDSGFAAVSLYSCFNVDVNNNEIYNSILPGSGYGVGVWSASAFVDINNNHIENCRHDITGNTAERKALNRAVEISDNTLIGASIDGSHAIDAHPVTIDYTVTKNKIYLKPSFYAFSDGAQQSVFSENEVHGGYGAVFRRGSVNDGVHVIKNNYIDGTSLSFTYRAWGSGIGESLVIENNNQQGGRYGVYLSSEQPESFRNIIISGNRFSDLSNKGVYQQFLIDGVNLEISDNTFENIREEGIYIDGKSFINGDVEIQNNNLINVYPSSPGSGITIKNIQGASVSGNPILEVADESELVVFKEAPAPEKEDEVEDEPAPEMEEVVTEAVTVPVMKEVVVAEIKEEVVPVKKEEVVAEAVTVPEIKEVVTEAVTVPVMKEVVVAEIKEEVVPVKKEEVVAEIKEEVVPVKKEVVTEAVTVPVMKEVVVAEIKEEVVPVKKEEVVAEIKEKVVPVKKEEVVAKAVTVPETKEVVVDKAVPAPETKEVVVAKAVPVPETKEVVVAKAVPAPVMKEVVEAEEGPKEVIEAEEGHEHVREAEKVVAKAVSAPVKDEEVSVCTEESEEEASVCTEEFEEEASVSTEEAEEEETGISTEEAEEEETGISTEETEEEETGRRNMHHTRGPGKQ